jgi:hypothetical protein
MFPSIHHLVVIQRHVFLYLPVCLLGALLDLDAFAILVLMYYDPVLLLQLPLLPVLLVYLEPASVYFLCVVCVIRVLTYYDLSMQLPLPLLLLLPPVLLYLPLPQRYGVPSVLRLPLSLQEF